MSAARFDMVTSGSVRLRLRGKRPTVVRAIVSTSRRRQYGEATGSRAIDPTALRTVHVISKTEEFKALYYDRERAALRPNLVFVEPDGSIGFETNEVQLHQVLATRTGADGDAGFPLRPSW